MKTRFAIVEGHRQEAEPGLKAKCPLCDQAMIAKCGEHRLWHWAHRKNRNCDTWWKPETEWHRNWKDKFPKKWQEIIHHSEVDEKHIADVKTDSGVVLEFQHSYLRREERESREKFYRNMVWVVDGLRRLRDRSRFFDFLGNASFESPEPTTFKIIDTYGECALLRDWIGSKVPVFFDFGDYSDERDLRHLRFDTPVLWLMYPGSSKGIAYISPVLKTVLLEACLEGHLLNLHYEPVTKRTIGPSVTVSRVQRTHRSRRPMSFQQYLARQQMARRRFRL